MSAQAAVSAFRGIARLTRQAASLGVLFLAVRLTWLAGADALKVAGGEMGEKLRGEKKSEPREPNELAKTKDAVEAKSNAHRPDLDKLKALDTKPASGVKELSPAPRPRSGRTRRLLVDIGPSRSEVFVDGRKVGHTPYGGHFTCAEGEPVRIQVLPPTGVPLERQATCQGEAIVANR